MSKPSLTPAGFANVRRITAATIFSHVMQAMSEDENAYQPEARRAFAQTAVFVSQLASTISHQAVLLNGGEAFLDAMTEEERAKVKSRLMSKLEVEAEADESQPVDDESGLPEDVKEVVDDMLASLGAGLGISLSRTMPGIDRSKLN